VKDRYWVWWVAVAGMCLFAAFFVGDFINLDFREQGVPLDIQIYCALWLGERMLRDLDSAGHYRNRPSSDMV
jgi:hypothetical protein